MSSLAFSIRVGVVTKVSRTRLYFSLSEKLDGQEFDVPIPHPYAGADGGGIFAGFEIGTLILVVKGPEEKWYCVGTIPNRNLYFDLDGLEDSSNFETPYPEVSPGELSLKNSFGSRMDFLNDGNIRIDAGIGLSLADLELSRDTESLFMRIPNKYKFTEAGRSIEGIIQRDMNFIERSVDTNTMNFLEGEEYSDLLSNIGRSPSDEVQARTTKLIKQALRNPALVEKREIIYEYAHSFDVRHFEDELKIPKADTPVHSRQSRRTDVLNLNSHNFNHLIEKVEGTLVDIYGNILDLNRNIISVPSVETVSPDGNDPRGLRRIYDYHRRGVKLHYEINSRKSLDGSEPPASDKTKDNARSFSRWSVDVDGEGLTKVNIPASSETGNIPVLGRYYTNINNEDKDLLVKPGKKEKERRDISIGQFGIPGPAIDNPDYASGGVVTTGTAFHDIMDVASSIFSSGKLKDNGPAMSKSINNQIGEKGGPKSGSDPANAGGRSLHANLDGSIEMSVGADTVDKKSIVLDTQGAVISHYGKDKNNRSIIHQSDGDVIIQIGGPGSDTNDSRFGKETSTSGRVEIHLARGSGTPQKIIIDEQGLTLDIQGNMIMKSSGDLALDAGARLMLHGEMVFVYGKTDVDARQVVGQETLVVRSGGPQFT